MATIYNQNDVRASFGGVEILLDEVSFVDCKPVSARPVSPINKSYAWSGSFTIKRKDAKALSDALGLGWNFDPWYTRAWFWLRGLFSKS